MIKTPKREDAEAQRRKQKTFKIFAPSRLRAFALKKQIFALFVLAAVVISAGCGGRKVPDLDKIFAQSKLRQGKRPVIIIPGILGSELVNAETRERVWINLSEAKSDGLTLPITPNLAENRDRLIPTRIIERAKVSAFLPEVSIYEALIQSMERYGGYTQGSWESAAKGAGALDKYYVFAYDWRRDNVENARLLVRRIEELKRNIGDEDLSFNVIAHSMGGLIARYAAMYGDADLPPDDAEINPNWTGAKHFNKIFMFGTPNEGSMATLELLIKGYRVGGFEINVLNRESAFTSPAVFQLLPHQAAARFYDEKLDPLKIDLYNPETWRKYGWSVYADASFRAKFTGQSDGRKNEFGIASTEELDAYFAGMLKRTKLFHEALGANGEVPSSLTFFAFGSDCDPTQDGAILYQNKQTGAWQTIFTPKSYKTSDGTLITREQTRERLYAPGDTRVTRRSLLAETAIEENYRNSIFRGNLPVTSVFFCESHERLPNSKIMQNNFITALVRELTQ